MKTIIPFWVNLAAHNYLLLFQILLLLMPSLSFLHAEIPDKELWVCQSNTPSQEDTLNNSNLQLPCHALQSIIGNSFKATNDGVGVLLEWMTIHEGHLHHFTLERSGDARLFEPIASILPESGAYAYIDENPPHKVNYYRLKIAGHKGRIAYSYIVAADIPMADTLKIFPNPVKDILSFRIPAPKHQYVFVLQIYSTDGRQLIQKPLDINNHIHSINIQGLCPGTYILRIYAKPMPIAQKFKERFERVKEYNGKFSIVNKLP